MCLLNVHVSSYRKSTVQGMQYCLFQNNSSWSLYKLEMLLPKQLQLNKLVESSVLLRCHPPLDLGIVEVPFILCSLGID